MLWSRELVNLSVMYKKFLILAMVLGVSSMLSAPVQASEAVSGEELEQMEESNYDSSTAYINDIEIYGSNIIKPEFILSKISLKKGDLYDKDAMQRDLKSIYKLGYFTERMKAIPVKNSNGTISLKIIVEENIPVTELFLLMKSCSIFCL